MYGIGGENETEEKVGKKRKKAKRAGMHAREEGREVIRGGKMVKTGGMELNGGKTGKGSEDVGRERKREVMKR